MCQPSIGWYNAEHRYSGIGMLTPATGSKGSDDELAHVNLYPAAFHGDDWNYVIKPNRKNQ